ncbi:MAG TPA: tRNA preQ1(34) S-adenosylmethionine ribosyltransferase-isomerase QueA [Thermodesulfobacteriota bacterium]|nr:tRNA preQ1(34) S-adenosylmethionine ribosyltransferase-isomerase QueA [Thermodesulfobacteriota bacterium]
MKTADFDYILPEELIAFYPLSRREESRLMVISRRDGCIEHKRFYELPLLLKDGDVLVLNNTKVLPARLLGRTGTGKRYEILLTERLSPRLWKGVMRNPRDGMAVEFEGGLKGKILRNGKDEWLIEFAEHPDRYIERFGKMPLPPYIRREPEEKDRFFYQTVYAEKEGAIAAPTAGLHFTEALLDEIRRRGVEIRYVTLHVGVGTFKPVKTENVENHRIHPEYREIPEETALSITRAKGERRRVFAVGTTVVRALESSVDESGGLRPEIGYTDLFIYPGFEFHIVDAMITNFHLPRSTLLMLVSAFAGRELILKAYEEAKGRGYRFLSYGDAMLIL